MKVQLTRWLDQSQSCRTCGMRFRCSYRRASLKARVLKRYRHCGAHGN